MKNKNSNIKLENLIKYQMERDNGKRNISEKTIKKDKDFDDSNNTKTTTNQSNLKLLFLT